MRPRPALQRDASGLSRLLQGKDRTSPLREAGELKHMRGVTGDEFREPYLKFRVRKPESWSFSPPAWTPVAQIKNADDSGTHWSQHANLPFCCARQHHDSLGHAYPTLQVTCRPMQVPDNATAAALLSATLDFLSDQYQDFEVHQATSEAVVAGFRTNVIRASFLMPAQPADDLIWLPVLSRAFLIFAPGRAFTVGLSSSADPEYFTESDFESIVASVRIGA